MRQAPGHKGSESELNLLGDICRCSGYFLLDMNPGMINYEVLNNHGGGIMENTKTEEQDIVVVAEADIQFMNLSTSHDTCSCRCIDHCSCDCDRCSWHTLDS